MYEAHLMSHKLHMGRITWPEIIASRQNFETSQEGRNRSLVQFCVLWFGRKKCLLLPLNVKLESGVM